MSKFRHGLLLAIFCLSFLFSGVRAQNSTAGPLYEVQAGDTLYLIALRFDVSVDDLVEANQITDPNVLSPGTRLVIPGLTGIEGLLVTENIQLGQNLTSLSRYYQVPVEQLDQLNRITSPAEVYTGASLIIPQSDRPARAPGGNLPMGMSLLEYAAIHQSSPWEVAAYNAVAKPADILPNEPLYKPSQEDESDPGSSLEPLVTKLELAPLPLVQGSTAVVHIAASQPVEIAGSLNGKDLHFFSNGENDYVAIQGIYALAEPGLAEFGLEVKTADGETRSYQQMLLLQDGYYPKDEPLTVDPATLDKAVTGPEDDLIRQTTAPANPQRAWSGIFRLPVDEPYCIRSWYGNRRSYNGSGYIYFHTGLDYGVCATLNIYAPAPGTVVYTGPLTVRGNATIIDHGWGVYSGFWHQSEILVEQGQTVQAGDLIGMIGGTGRVTGPHLHWEVWANGVQVNPQEWLDRAIP